MALDGEIGYALIQSSARAIGQIYADVTIEEGHRDETVITRHPVEGGATIGDHAFDLPPTVEIRGGFSNSTAGYVGYVQEQYQALLALKASKRPFDLYTGKRRYQDMLIAGISVVTDPRTENVLLFTVVCQHITIVRTQTTGGGGTDAAPASDPSNQADPASTGSVSNLGSVDGIGQGSQSFAGAFNPGAYSPDGGTTAGYAFGLNEISPGQPASTNIAGDVVEPAPITANIPTISTLPELSGLSPPAPLDEGVAVFSDPSTGQVVGIGSGQTTYGDRNAPKLNIFGSGKAGR